MRVGEGREGRDGVGEVGSGDRGREMGGRGMREEGICMEEERESK